MKNNIKFATILSYITLFLGSFLSVVYTPFMLSKLGSSEYGLFSLVNTIISYLFLLDLGLGNAVIRYNSKYLAQKNYKKLSGLNGMFLSLYSAITVLAAGTCFVIYTNMNTIFGQGLSLVEINQLKIMFIIAIINLVFALPLSVFNGIILAYEKFVFTKILALIRTVLNPLVMILVLFFGYGAIGMLAASTALNIFLGFVSVYYCFKNLKIKLNFCYFDKKLFYNIFQYSFFIFLTAIASRIYWSTDQFLLGMFVGAAPIAVYAIGSQLNGYFTSFSNVISSLFLPKLTKIIQEENFEKKAMELLVKISRIQYFIATFVLLVFIFIGQSFIEIWAGDGYQDSYWIAVLIMVPQLFSIVQSLFATLLEAMNKHRVKSLIYLFVAILNVVITLLLIPSLGIFGCALGTAIGMIINAIANNVYYSKYLKLDMRYYWKKMAKLLPATVIVILGSYGLSVIINPKSIVEIGLYSTIFGLLYLVTFWFLGFNELEKKMILSVVKRG